MRYAKITDLIGFRLSTLSTMTHEQRSNHPILLSIEILCIQQKTSCSRVGNPPNGLATPKTLRAIGSYQGFAMIQAYFLFFSTIPVPPILVVFSKISGDTEKDLDLDLIFRPIRLTAHKNCLAKWVSRRNQANNFQIWIPTDSQKIEMGLHGMLLTEIEDVAFRLLRAKKLCIRSFFKFLNIRFVSRPILNGQRTNKRQLLIQLQFCCCLICFSDKDNSLCQEIAVKIS